ncbi:MAG: RnfABCDGE type electron transport complex subunit D [Lachnospiraceae bacterium]|jgi:electron transport complex protein RnfD|nr:RnfABCDGE type electron transport complex subunit D [Lachnospiraceae bacterium]
MDERFIVTASPHIRDKASTQGLMGDVLISLIPCIIAATLIFGFRAFMVIAVTTAACMAFEYVYCKLLHKKIPVSDLSACVTGVILGMNMPSNMPFWICIVGAFVAIIITKQLFGGLGFNFANPALVGRIVLFLGFTGSMTNYVHPEGVADAISSATVLAATVDKSTVSLIDMVIGIRGGVLGETCAIAILLGLAYLLIRRVINISIPASIILTVFVLALIADRSIHNALVEVMSGGLLFGAVFMATDYVTSPFNAKGRVMYGIFIGVIVFAIRRFGSMNGGVSYAILLGNLLTPWFNEWSHQIPLGFVKKKKAKKAAPQADGKGGKE